MNRVFLLNIQIFNKQMNSNQKQTYCLGGRHYSQTVNKTIFEKLKTKTKKLVKIIKGTCSICGRNKSKTYNK